VYLKLSNSAGLILDSLIFGQKLIEKLKISVQLFAIVDSVYV